MMQRLEMGDVTQEERIVTCGKNSFEEKFVPLQPKIN
jgi:hypothetical protein